MDRTIGSVCVIISAFLIWCVLLTCVGIRNIQELDAIKNGTGPAELPTSIVRQYYSGPSQYLHAGTGLGTTVALKDFMPEKYIELEKQNGNWYKITAFLYEAPKDA